MRRRTATTSSSRSSRRSSASASRTRMPPTHRPSSTSSSPRPWPRRRSTRSRPRRPRACASSRRAERMVRRLVPLALLVVIAVLASSAHADTFAVVPAAPLALPGLTPNPSLSVPDSLSTPPAAPVQLSYPQLLGLWQQAGAAYGIPWQVLAAINKVESNWGRNMGPSSAGAIGWMQFMPSTWLRWGVDANGDGIADPWNPTDAIYSAARYLAAAGGTTDLYRGVYAYNHADWYVHEVLSLAALYGGNSTVAFSLDRLQENLDGARAATARKGELVIAAEKLAGRAARNAARLQSRAANASLLSDRLALEQRA